MPGTLVSQVPSQHQLFLRASFEKGLLDHSANGEKIIFWHPDLLNSGMNSGNESWLREDTLVEFLLVCFYEMFISTRMLYNKNNIVYCTETAIHPYNICKQIQNVYMWGACFVDSFV